MDRHAETRPAPSGTAAPGTGGAPARSTGTEPGDHETGSRAWLVPLAIVAVLALLYFGYPPFRDFVHEAYDVLSSGDRARTERWVQDFGAWGPAAVIALMVAQTVIPVIPSVLIMVVTVLAFGPLWGGVLTYAGLLLAAAVAYGLGHALGACTVRRLLGASTERKIEEFVRRYGFGGVVVARVSPVISTDAVSFVAGLVGMGFARFALATALGTLPLTVLVAWLGQGIDRMQTGLAVVSVVSAVAFVAYVLHDRRRRAQAATSIA